MGREEYIRIGEIVKEQERLLRFEHFSNRDAWELGAFLAQKAHDSGTEIAIAVRKLNGAVVFQYLSDGTNLNNQNWMRRKFNAVALEECSSLALWASMMAKNAAPEDMGMNAKEYALCGGGFPVRLKSGEIVAVLTVSNLPHLQDHQFMIDGLQEWLKAENVPQI